MDRWVQSTFPVARILWLLHDYRSACIYHLWWSDIWALEVIFLISLGETGVRVDTWPIRTMYIQPQAGWVTLSRQFNNLPLWFRSALNSSKNPYSSNWITCFYPICQPLSVKSFPNLTTVIWRPDLDKFSPPTLIHSPLQSFLISSSLKFFFRWVPILRGGDSFRKLYCVAAILDPEHRFEYWDAS